MQQQSGSIRVGQFALKVAAPLAMLALAYGAWAISDWLVYIGPFDRAQFGWLVVTPLLAAAPVVAGFAWHGLDTRRLVIATVAVAGLVGFAAGALFAAAVVGDSAGCRFGTRLSSGEMALAGVLVGFVAGGGYAASGLSAAVLIRNHQPWLGTVAGAIGGFAVLWIAAFAGLAAIGYVGICNRQMPI